MKKVLIITYYWPPAGGPGVQRWLKFVKHLPEFGIEPIVLTVDPDFAVASDPAVDPDPVVDPDLAVAPGFPVDPDVYKMNKGSSELIFSGLHFEETFEIASCHQISFLLSICTGSPVRRTTITWLIEGVSFTALSAFFFMKIFCFSPLTHVSWVTNTLHLESFIRSLSESLEKAPKTTE